MGLLWINLFVISRSFKTPLCSKNGTVVGIVQNKTFFVTRHGTNLGFTQHFATQPCDSKHVSHTTTLCVHVLDTFKKLPSPLDGDSTTEASALAKEVLGTQQQACWIFSKMHLRPGTPWCHGAIATTLCVRALRNTL